MHPALEATIGTMSTEQLIARRTSLAKLPLDHLPPEALEALEEMKAAIVEELTLRNEDY